MFLVNRKSDEISRTLILNIIKSLDFLLYLFKVKALCRMQWGEVQSCFLCKKECIYLRQNM